LSTSSTYSSLECHYLVLYKIAGLITDFFTDLSNSSKSIFNASPFLATITAMKTISYTLLSILLLILFYLGLQAHLEAKKYEAVSADIVSHLTLEDQARYQMNALLEEYSLGYFEHEARIEIERLLKEQAFHKHEAQRFTRYFMSLILLLLGSYFIVNITAFTFFGALGALITLFFGLITPVLMLTIHKEVEYLGDIVFSFESKGVLGSVMKLFEGDNLVIGLVILLFSILIPLLKTLSLLYISLFIKNSFTQKIVTFFKVIGKWSMVDVFVVATFLVFMSTNNSEMSRAEVEVGLYFFLAYVILSILLSIGSDKMLKEFKND